MMQAKAKLGYPVLWPLAVLLTAALMLVGLTSSASAGSDGNNNGAGANSPRKCHKKSNKGANQGAKTSTNKKCKKRKSNQGPETPPATPPVVTPPGGNPPAATTLSINPTSFDFGTASHGGFGACGADPDPDCPTHAFTVTNTGGSTSGVPTASIVETHNSEIGGPPAFRVMANTCTAALAPGASCSLTVKFAPNSNAGDETFSSRLDVTASPGSTASSVLSGMAS